QYSPIVEVDCAPASFTIYPNPATDRVFVNGREEVLYLYDCMGTFIRQMDPEKNGEEISLEDLPNGVYFVGGKGIAGSDMQRIIKMQ
ncbi:MAG TPA: T9SS type A sorting domain-containing protein, partial [Saprospiraceae bacterium]|nr:T9SS type A sorting domain-containing protein [Saprospiraceae bacterium]